MPSPSSLGKEDNYSKVLYEMQECINTQGGPSNDIDLQEINHDQVSNQRNQPHLLVINSPIFNKLAEILHNVPPTLMQRNNRGYLGLIQTPTQEIIDVTTPTKF